MVVTEGTLIVSIRPRRAIFRRCHIAVLLACAALGAPHASAQETANAGPAAPTTVPDGSCFLPPAVLSAAEIAAFKADPNALLTRYPDGGTALALATRGLSGSNASVVSRFVQLAASAGPSQILAIGTGLSQSAKACVQERPDFSEYIQLEVASSGNDALISAFLGASQDVSTAALPGGPNNGGGAPAIGGGPLGSAGQAETGNFVLNTPFTFGSSGGGSSFTVVNGANSVSPSI